MIRKLTAEDHSEVMDFLGEEPSINLFIIGDIETFGYQTDFQEVWGEFGDGGINAVLLRYYNFFIPYAKGSFDATGFASIIRSYPEANQISGKASVITVMEEQPGICRGRKQETFFAECTQLEPVETSSHPIKKAGMEDIERILDLRRSIPEFHIQPDAKELMKKEIETGTGRTYYLEQDGLITASASTAAENSISAMIVGVCTSPEYRKNGFATDTMAALCGDLIKEGKTLCLFYDNPAAGQIYKRLGFKDIGKWTMYRGG